MAGARQHIIPRFLQKGFASRIITKKKRIAIFTWLYIKNGSSPKEVSITDSIVGEYFYGKGGELNADDEITKVEEVKFSPLVDKLRKGMCNFDESKVEIAELIAHLFVRTKLVRKGFEQMSGKMLEGFKEILTDEDTISNVLLKPDKNKIKSVFDEALMDSDNPELNNALEVFQILGFEKEDVKELVTDLTIFNLNDEKSKEQTNDFVSEVFSKIFNESILSLPQSIKDGHIKSLLENTIPTSRVEKYKQFDWNVFEVDSPIILGDVGCIFRIVGEDTFKPSCDIENTNQIYLPISSNQILIGANVLENLELNVEVLNRAIAKTSFEQFICCEESGEKTALAEIIGTDAYLASDEEIENELNEIRNNIEKLIES